MANNSHDTSVPSPSPKLTGFPWIITLHKLKSFFEGYDIKFSSFHFFSSLNYQLPNFSSSLQPRHIYQRGLLVLF